MATKKDSVNVTRVKMKEDCNSATFIPSGLMNSPSARIICYTVIPDAAKIIEAYKAEESSEEKTISKEQFAAAVKELQLFNEILTFRYTAKLHTDGRLTLRFTVKCDVTTSKTFVGHEFVRIEADKLALELLNASEFISVKANGNVERQMSFHCSVTSKEVPSINSYLYEYTKVSDR